MANVDKLDKHRRTGNENRNRNSCLPPQIGGGNWLWFYVTEAVSNGS